jgi:aspartokinase/homoserine dehydrogenase 1
MKFGGTSMGSARRILESADIIIQRAAEDRVSVIVSAVAGVSNKLQDSIDGAVGGTSAEMYVPPLRTLHQQICDEIHSKLSAFNSAAVTAKIEPLFCEYEKLLKGITAFGECPDTVHCRIMGFGELISSQIMEAVLLARGTSVILLDSRKFILAAGDQKEGDPDYIQTAENFAPYRDGDLKNRTQILLLPGFVCSWTGGTGCKPVAGLLGRNGSDFSAAIVGASLAASRVEFWTDVDGIYTADPRIVKDAILVDDMSYEEAMELSFFGSKVLHPKTLAPLAVKGIEAWSLNSHNPAARGTRIGKGPFDSQTAGGAVRGISCLKHISMLSVSGTSMKGRTGMASRVFAAVSNAGISVLLITQSSSEYTISFCVRDSNADKALDVLEREFELEISDGILNPVEVRKKCAVVSIVGDKMRQKRGIAGKFFDALASQDVNILAIAQGSSERSISVVIRGEMGDIAVRAAHLFFFNTSQTVEIYAFGAGTIGGALLNQIRDQKQQLLEQKVDLKVMAIATKHHMLIASEDSAGLDMTNWQDSLTASPLKYNLDEVLNFVKKTKPLNPVFVDCTAAYDLPERYIDIFRAGMHIATPNKRANSMSMDYYRELRRVANLQHRRFLYETNVGAGLPIIDNLQNLFKSGDRLTGFRGIMSGSLSYIFGRLDEGVSFSSAVIEAKEKGFTEPDPRDDLNGLDVARKVLIIAREAGYELEIDDVEIKKVFPDDFDSEGTTEEFLKRLPQVDSYFKEKVDELRTRNKVLRMGASITDGKCSVGMIEVSQEEPLYTVKGGENAFVFHTARYNPIPLTVRGYGAGADVTAAGVFGDILRTVSFNPERK